MDDQFTITLQQQAGYRFEVDFGQPGVPPLQTDEPPPLGHAEGPNPARLLAAAVANCLAASLTFALRKFHNEPGPLQVQATGRYARNEQGRMRIGGMQVTLRLAEPAASLKMAERALAQFEDFCVVTQSVRAGFPVEVEIFDSAGARMK